MPVCPLKHTAVTVVLAGPELRQAAGNHGIAAMNVHLHMGFKG